MNGYHGGSDDDSQSVGSYSSNLSGASGEDSGNGDDGSQSEMMGGSGTGSSRDGLKIARTESNFVLCSKFVAYLVLFLSAVAAGVAAFYFTRDQEISEFEDDVS
eukprot:scaffold4420_cov187-Amphora_coffeaeformis.AAC.16